MTLKFFAYIRDADFAGCKEMPWNDAPKDVRELGEQLSARFGAKFRGEFFTPDGRDLGERIIVLINGRNVKFLQGIDSPLRDSDTVLIFPVVAGG